MFENVLLWLLNRLYPKPEVPQAPAVAVNVKQTQTVKKTVGRPRKAAVKKPAVVAKTVAKKKAKVKK
jgi:hypothetical protein